MSAPSSSMRSDSSRRSQSHDELVNDMLSSTLGTDEHATVLLKYGLMAVGVLAVLKIISQSLLYYTLIASPFVYGYLKTTCPSQDTFDATQELKTILGGDHLPDAHPDKPKSKLQQLLASTKANVTAEYAALIGDTRTEFTDLVGCLKLAKVTSQQRTHYWVGVQNQWRYMGSTPQRTSAVAETTTDFTANQSVRRRSSAPASASSTTSSASASLLSSFTSSMSKKTS